MTKRTKVTRQSKVDAGLPKETKGKFASIPVLTPLNDRQASAMKMLEERTIVFLAGCAGTGKSLLAAYHAAKKLAKGETKGIVLVRPAVAVGKSIGLLPGTVEEKLAPYFAQTIDHLTSFLGKGKVECDLRTGTIQMFPVEYMRGMSFEDKIVIFEESQNFTAEELNMIVTRLGRDCQFIFTGDQAQHDLRGVSGLTDVIGFIRHILREEPEYMTDDMLYDLEEQVGVVDFTPDDVVRSGLTKAFVTMYHYREGK